MLNTDRLCPGCMNDNEGENVCSVCGCESTVSNDEAVLPVRSWLADRYLIGKAYSSDSKGVTYIGWDNSADVPVKVREYFPASVAQRNPDKTVSIASGKEFAFNEGLMEFIEISKALISTELPAIVPINSVFEENGTVYSISPTTTGISLSEFLDRNGGMLKWEQARPLFLPLIDTVKGLNDAGIIHGGISPDTILVGRDGKLRLTDICVSGTRSVSGDIEPTLYDGYSAIEQYGFENAKIAPCTDVYGLSATLFRVIIGNTPDCAEERIKNDALSIPSHFADELPRQVLVALANGLQVIPANRTASVEIFRNELVYGETQENARRAAAARKAQEQEKSKTDKPASKASGAKYAMISAVCTVLVFVILAAVLCLTVFKDQIFGTPEDNSSREDTSTAAPVVPSIGDVDSDAAETKTLYAVPDLSGKYYSDIIDDEEYEKFEFSIKAKEFSTKYPRGTVCAQSVNAGTSVEKDTKIELTISLGTQEVKIANVSGMDESSAKIELLKQGFLYENIEIVDKYDVTKEPGIVLEQKPAYGSTVNLDEKITIYKNSYDGGEGREGDYFGDILGEN